MMRGEPGQHSLRESHFALACVGTVLLLDQVSKGLVLTQFTAIPRIIHVNSFLNVILNWNYGISLGFFNYENKYAFYVILMISLISIYYLLILLKKTSIFCMKIFISFIVGGAIGNTIDRLRHNYVIDFIDLHFFNLHYPTFNIADIAITMGAIALMSNVLLRRQDTDTGTFSGL